MYIHREHKKKNTDVSLPHIQAAMPSTLGK